MPHTCHYTPHSENKTTKRRRKKFSRARKEICRKWGRSSLVECMRRNELREPVSK